MIRVPSSGDMPFLYELDNNIHGFDIFYQEQPIHNIYKLSYAS